ncbi:MAG: beta-lactamase family protein [Lachnospiraceae bacterium]|nr:beta-lactamase family protein [Lachnospiraceae bacterium]
MTRSKTFLRLMAFVIGLLIVMICPLSSLGTRNGLEEMVSEFRRETKCPAVSVVTYDHGTVEYCGDEKDLFQIGSMTKAFTGLAVQKLIHEGTLKESDKVSDILTGFVAYYQGAKVEITVGQLMRQTSGYTNSEKAYPSAKAGQTLSAWAESISGKNLQSAPGEKYAYSNVNYNLLGAMMEKVTGRSYQDYLEQEILTPLGLTNTYVGEPEGMDVGGKSLDAGNTVMEGSRLFFRQAIPYHVAVRKGAIPAGYFYSNVADMGRWMEIWMGIAEVPEEYQELVREVKSELKEKGDYYGGWECFGDGVTGHSGGTPNYSSRIVFSEKDGVGVCVLTNLNVAASVDSLCNGLLEMLRGGKKGAIASDVWTIFDQVFSALCVAGVFVLLVCIRSKKRGMLMAVGGGMLVLTIVMVITFPLIFGAGLLNILLIWAPLSMATFFGVTLLCVIMAGIKIWMGRRYEDHKKTSEGSAAYGDRGVSGI